MGIGGEGATIVEVVGEMIYVALTVVWVLLGEEVAGGRYARYESEGKEENSCELHY